MATEGFRIKFKFYTLICLVLLAPTLLPISSIAPQSLSHSCLCCSNFEHGSPELPITESQHVVIKRLISIPLLTSKVFTSDFLTHHLVYFFPSLYHNQIILLRDFFSSFAKM